MDLLFASLNKILQTGLFLIPVIRRQPSKLQDIHALGIMIKEGRLKWEGKILFDKNLGFHKKPVQWEPVNVQVEPCSFCNSSRLFNSYVGPLVQPWTIPYHSLSHFLSITAPDLSPSSHPSFTFCFHPHGYFYPPDFWSCLCSSFCPYLRLSTWYIITTSQL